MLGWLAYFGVVLAASLVLGWHLGRFREACSEMTGMMAGMTIGMLGGFALGFGMTAAAERNLFWGNLIGVLLGAGLGGWFGRPGGLMGIMDGSMGGIMGGSMGAMIAAMLYPDWALNWTGALFAGIYVVGAAALTALIESRTPEHAHLHWLLPKLTRRPPARAVRAAAKAIPPTSRRALAAGRSSSAAVVKTQVAASSHTAPPEPPMQDYYALLKVDKEADLARIEDAYLDLLAGADAATLRAADRALATLRDPERRLLYDFALAESKSRQAEAAPQPAVTTSAADGRGDCCPPPKKKVEAAHAAAEKHAAARPQAAQVPARPATAPATVAASAAKPAVALPPKGQQAAQKQANKQTQKAHQAQKGQGKRDSYRDDYRGGYSDRDARRYGRADGSPRRNARDGRYQQQGFGRQMATGVGVGMAAVLVLALLIMILFAGGGGNSAQAAGNGYNNPRGAVYHAPAALPNQAQLEQTAVAATLGTDGVQKADLVLDDTNSTYKPAAIKVKKGVPVRLNLSEVGGSKDCRSVVRLTALGAQGFVEPGQVTAMDFTPTQPGVYEFNCPMRMMNPSYLVVTD